MSAVLWFCCRRSCLCSKLGGGVGVKRGAVVPSYFAAERRVLRFWIASTPPLPYFASEPMPLRQVCPREREMLAASVSLSPSLPAPSCAPAAAGNRLLEPCTRCRGAAAAPAASSLLCPPRGRGAASALFVFHRAGAHRASPHKCIMANRFGRRTGSARPCRSLGSGD